MCVLYFIRGLYKGEIEEVFDLTFDLGGEVKASLE